MTWSDEDDQRYVSRARLTELLGADVAARIVSVFGGQRIYVPAPTSTESYGRFVARIGDLEIARKLCFQFGGTQIILPQRLVSKRDEILRLKLQGLSAPDISLRLRAGINYVYQVLRAERHAQ